MSIPLDRLYQYIEQLAKHITNDCVIIYRFWPHGSKKLSDFNTITINSFKDCTLYPKIFCADQEPLNYDYYEQIEHIVDPLQKIWKDYSSDNFANARNLKQGFPITYDYYILLHTD